MDGHWDLSSSSLTSELLQIPFHHSLINSYFCHSFQSVTSLFTLTSTVLLLTLSRIPCFLLEKKGSTSTETLSVPAHFLPDGPATILTQPSPPSLPSLSPRGSGFKVHTHSLSLQNIQSLPLLPLSPVHHSQVFSILRSLSRHCPVTRLPFSDTFPSRELALLGALPLGPTALPCGPPTSCALAHTTSRSLSPVSAF